jgi:hypothetical protein
MHVCVVQFSLVFPSCLIPTATVESAGKGQVLHLGARPGSCDLSRTRVSLWDLEIEIERGVTSIS